MVPVNARLAMLKVALPVLFKATVWAALVISTAWLPKARLVGERLTRAAVPVPAVPVAAVCVPVPDRLAVCGLPLACP